MSQDPHFEATQRKVEDIVCEPSGRVVFPEISYEDMPALMSIEEDQMFTEEDQRPQLHSDSGPTSVSSGRLECREDARDRLPDDCDYLSDDSYHHSDDSDYTEGDFIRVVRETQSGSRRCRYTGRILYSDDES